jgi:hypothetical protein
MTWKVIVGLLHNVLICTKHADIQKKIQIIKIPPKKPSSSFLHYFMPVKLIFYMMPVFRILAIVCIVLFAFILGTYMDVTKLASSTQDFSFLSWCIGDVPLSGISHSMQWQFTDISGPIDSPETSVRIYLCMLCKIPKIADLDNGSFPHHMQFPCGWSRSPETCRVICVII